MHKICIFCIFVAYAAIYIVHNALFKPSGQRQTGGTFRKNHFAYIRPAAALLAKPGKPLQTLRRMPAQIAAALKLCIYCVEYSLFIRAPLGKYKVLFGRIAADAGNSTPRRKHMYQLRRKGCVFIKRILRQNHAVF